MKRWLVILLHAGYWATYLLLLAVIFGILRIEFPHGPSLFTLLLASRIGLLAIAPNLVAFYLSYFLLFPRLLARRRIVALLAGGVAVSAASAALGVVGVYLSIPASQAVLSQRIEMAGVLAGLTLVAAIHATIALVVRGFVGWYGDIRLKEELRRNTAEVEMALVRSKLDPHFLFNTLNNIDVLIARDPQTASAYLNKLCDIMRFVLYETRSPTIPLSWELRYIGQYVDLERIRSTNPDHVHYEIRGDPAGLMVAPMIFIPCIENAFTHGAGRKGVVIRIQFRIDGNRIVFDCSNHHRRGGEKQDGGLGNELLRRRLALLYPQRHTLETSDDEDTYTMRLTVELG
jgi:two-component system LytT family sensor kinase